MTFNVWFIMGIVFISSITGMSIESVGHMPTDCSPFEWYLPIIVFFMLGLPFILGYMAGQE